MASGGKSQKQGDRTATDGEQLRQRRAQAVSWLNVACDLLAESHDMARQVSAWAKSAGLIEAELRLLWSLRQLGGHESSGDSPDQKRLATMMGASAAQVSGLVQRLQGRGWIAGGASPDDRRRQRWWLTPTGTVLLDQVVAQIAAQEEPCDAAHARTEAA